MRLEFQSHLSKSAGTGNRTRDLRTTNATLYRLSHASIYSLVHLSSPSDASKILSLNIDVGKQNLTFYLKVFFIVFILLSDNVVISEIMLRYGLCCRQQMQGAAENHLPDPSS